ncbi:hypothetical protein [Sphingobium sp. B12D2B]|uniref:hypothetical protein n=1 Tax=Sphingobium sp. B12D2B TaxID=2940577 RepID=UPI00222438A1|nr:hypothetical protein [Sphingobium sp. B12D2B]MCW2351794.1 hypothetical protein [Sphingobium sp. B12D2B]
MKAGQIILSLNISEQLCALARDCLRLRDNETKSLYTVEALLSEHFDPLSVADDLAPRTIRQYLSAIPTSGAVSLILSVSSACAQDLETLRQILSERLETDLSIAEAISILLFHYMVGQTAERVLRRVGFASSQASPILGATLQHASDNVIRLR